MSLLGNIINKRESENENEMSFWEHLEALRWHLIRSVLVVLVLAVAAFLNKKFIFEDVILAPKNPDFLTNDFFCKMGEKLHIAGLCANELSFKIVNLTVAGQFLTHINISFMAGFIVGFPYIIWELWRFINPALYEKERKNFRKAIFAIGILFFIGVLMGYYLILPVTISFLTSYNLSPDITNTINLSSYISMVANISFSMGIVFELPVISYFLSKLGILSPEIMRQYRRHAVVIIIILAAIITPSSDVFTLAMVALPLYFLYEISVYVSMIARKKKTETED